jgi:uncharacterized membrane protein
MSRRCLRIQIMVIDWFSPAQCVGYIAFVLGVGSFVQTDDRRFKLLMAGECLAYIVHFALLGNPTAVASSSMSLLRSLLSLRTRSIWVAVAVIAANLLLGLNLARHASDWLPLGASCLGTLALFLLRGVAMRLLMLCGTGLWIANNILAGSVGGTALEVVIAIVNTVTILRMVRQARAKAAAETAAEEAPASES